MTPEIAALLRLVRERHDRMDDEPLDYADLRERVEEQLKCPGR